jgi:hypothetical protein
MNFTKNYLNRNKLISYIRYSNRTGSHSGCVRLFPNNTIEHEVAKLEVMYYLMNRGFECWSEVIFNSGKRADIVAISDKAKGYIIEVMHTETLNELNEKIKDYPADFEIIKIKTPFNKKDIIL